MKLSVFLWFVLCAIIIAGSYSDAAAKRKPKSYFKLVEAYSQRTLGGRPGAPPETGNHFIIIWRNDHYPETFFWRGDGGWLSCNMLKAHKVKGKAKNMPKGMDYRTEFITGDQVHKGDTLELSPVTRGKFPIPADIPLTAKNTLFFKTGGSGWLSFPVKKINKKQDISLP